MAKKGFNKLPALTKQVGKLAGKRINVGVFNDQAEKAIIHTYGTENCPPRPFLGPALNGHTQQYAAELAKISDAAIADAVNSGKDPDFHIFDALRAMIEGDVKQFIKSNQVQPPTTAETNKRKGSDITLIDTGKLVESITTRMK